MKIRTYQASDEADVINLWVKCGLVVPWNNPHQDIERKLKVHPELFLVGTRDDEVIASVMGGYEGHRGWINYLAVDPAYRRRGYGQKMMTAVKVKLKAMGCPRINLQVRSSNASVIRFYEAIGYKQDDVVSFGRRLVED
ncbi:MAG TPA: GNAT family acetyltransferase [Chloroflexi bacterium]|nr:MAG: GNAT family acetyltransferase [Anaerolineaceae bacterium 4572_5.2]HEY84360.1 GNAT family acetyltransferase [Chloroflexota bacterium]